MAWPVIAAAIAAIASGAGSAVAGQQGSDNIDTAQGKINALKAQFPAQAGEIERTIREQYAPLIENAGDDMKTYRDAVESADWDGMEYDDADPFSYDLQQGINKFMSPDVDYQIKQATGAVEGSAANAGKLFSSSTGKGIADRAQEISKNSYKDAMQAAMADRGFEYDVYGGDIERQRGVRDKTMEIAKEKIGGYGQLAGYGADATQRYGDLIGGVKQDMYTSQNNADLASATLETQRPTTGWAAFMSGAGQGLGNMSAMMGSQ